MSYETGYEIEGITSSEETALVFHAGTKLDNGSVLTDGGRVLTVVGQGGDLAEARQRAYDAAKHIRFQGSFYRSDIADPARRDSRCITALNNQMISNLEGRLCLL